jgi:hypothetical protein
MKMSNTRDVPEENWASPKGKSVGAGRGMSEALGRASPPQPISTNCIRSVSVGWW